jgi:hypothetical protein
VRPPVPVLLRGFEMSFLPDSWQIMAERWGFYLKVAIYSLLAASMLGQGKQRWMLAALGFVVSAHCYPPMAWHTVDGIFFAVFAAYFWKKGVESSSSYLFYALSALALATALMCKQSFYPLVFVFGVVMFVQGFMAFAWYLLWLGLGLFGIVWSIGFPAGLWAMTSGSSTGGQAFQHGVLDYFSITPELALPSILLIIMAIYVKKQAANWSLAGLRSDALLTLIWIFWLLALPISFVFVTLDRAEHTVPFAQARALFWLAAFSLAYWRLSLHFPKYFQSYHSNFIKPRKISAALVLLSISYCASISWGYNLPILFATPMLWVVMMVTTPIFSRFPWVHYAQMAYFCLLLFTFRIGHEFVYRDGKRSEMTRNMGEVFPKLSGIYSDSATYNRYDDLKRLAHKYGENFSVLPAFPLANYLTNSTPPLPLDWVVKREMAGQESLVWKALLEKRPILLLEKNYLNKIETDPELALTKAIFAEWTTLEESPFFIVKSLR